MPTDEQKANELKKLPGIFISYRRSDTPDAVGRIYDRLVAEFGKARVFKDVDSIPLGQDFRGHLNDIVGGCAAVLAIIGPKWTDIRNEAGQKRLEDPDDFVRIELEAALARSVPVVPVLVGHAPMPGPSQLPSSLASLAFRQSIEVRPDPDFHNDATRLVVALRKILDPSAAQTEGPSTAIASRAVSTARAPLIRWMAMALAAAIILAATLAVPALQHLRETPPPETRTEINSPATDQPGDFALSPDGKQIVFVAKGDGAQRLWIRPLSTTTAQPLPGTEGATAPFWSPDSRSLGFFAEDSLKRLDLDVGTPRTLAQALGQAKRTGTWNAEGDIVFSGSQLAPISRIAADGGQVSAVTRLGPREVVQRDPHFLPDGRRFLYWALGVGINVASLEGGVPVHLLSSNSDFDYSTDGWVLWLEAGSLMAQRVDAKKVTLAGKPLKIADKVDYVSAGPHGLLAYRAASIRHQLTWVDRSGAVQATVSDSEDTVGTTHISPDGRRLAEVHPVHDHQDVWVRDGESMSRLTFELPMHFNPIWSSDGTHVIYMSTRSGTGDIYQKLASGAGAEELLQHSDQAQVPFSMSPDGRFLLYGRVAQESGDIWVLPMSGDRKPFVFLQTPSSEGGAQFSPDGHWVVYQSNETGQFEVYIRPFVVPGAGNNAASAAGQVQISTGGGNSPVWRTDGKELYFLNQANDMMAVSITASGSTLVSGAPVRLFKSGITFVPSNGVFTRDYDVAPDGTFLINRELDTGVPAPITLIQNWNPNAHK